MLNKIYDRSSPNQACTSEFLFYNFWHGNAHGQAAQTKSRASLRNRCRPIDSGRAESVRAGRRPIRAKAIGLDAGQAHTGRQEGVQAGLRRREGESNPTGYRALVRLIRPLRYQTAGRSPELDAAIEATDEFPLISSCLMVTARVGTVRLNDENSGHCLFQVPTHNLYARPQGGWPPSQDRPTAKWRLFCSHSRAW